MDGPSSPNLEACTSKATDLEPQADFGRGTCNSDAASEGLHAPLRAEVAQQDDTEFPRIHAATPVDDPEGSDAVKILDQEIAELDQLLVLQGKKLDALQRLREQWMSGQRRLPDTMPPSGKLSPRGKITESVLQDYEGISDYGRQPWDEVASMNRFEHHAIPFVRIPLSSPLVDMELLSFRLKRSHRASGTSSIKSGVGRPGFLTVLACLHVDGVVRLRDTSGEEILAFDAGHKKALSPSMASERSGIVGLYGDASESNPVVVSVGADGAVRVHALKVYLRGKRVAGGARDGKENGSRKAEKARTEEGTPSTSGRRLDNQDGLSDLPPETMIGVAIALDFQVCLGPSCASGPLGEKLPTAGSEERRPNKSVDEEDARTVDGLPPDASALITSVDVFYHRAVSSTIVVAGYSTGGVRLYHGGNGTVLGSADAESSVLAVKRGGQSIAYSDGSNVRFVSVSNLEKTPDRVCRGDEGHMVTALAFDTVSPGTLYVGYETGMVMAFSSKIQEVDGSYRCLPAYRLEVPQFNPEASPRFFDQARASQASSKFDSGGGSEGQHSYSRMSTVKGYAIATRGPMISVYNTTEEVKLLFMKSLGGGDGDGDCETVGQAYQPGGGGGPIFGRIAPRWRVMSSPVSGEALVVEIGRCKEDVVVYKAILPFERKRQDMIWMRLPVILLGLLVVAVTQVYMKKAKNDDSGSSRRSRRSRRVRFGSDDDGRDLGLSSELADIRRELDSVGSRGWERSETDTGSFRRGTPSSRRYGDSWDSD